uniref:Complex III subunit 3 n=1 Tax=Dracunculus medinensis TaxID=318479 RepID=A0A0N4U4Z6_DRAME
LAWLGLPVGFTDKFKQIARFLLSFFYSSDNSLAFDRVQYIMYDEVSGATLKFFFAVHFLLPWFIFVLVVFHLIMLHVTGRTSVLSGFGDYDKIGFFPYYWLKDSYNLVDFTCFS